MKSFLFFSLFCLSPLLVDAQCTIDPNNVYLFMYDGKLYEIVKENQTWTAAAQCAVDRGGYLAEINSQEENDSIFYHMNQAGITNSNTVAPDGGGASYLWIGGNDLAVEGEWIWDGDNIGVSTQFWQGTSSGSPVGGLYNNWGNEPDDYNGQDGLGIAITNWPLGVAGEWNDVDDQNTLYYIIEHPVNSTGFPVIPKGNFLVYPNPSNGVLTIDCTEESDDLNYQLLDQSGRVVQTGKLTDHTQIQLPETAGLYTVQFLDGDQFLKAVKVTRQ